MFSELRGSNKASSRVSFTSPTDATRIWGNSESLVSSTRCRNLSWDSLATSRTDRTRKAWCLVRGSMWLLATAGKRLQSETVMWDERLGGNVFDCRKCKVRVRTARDSSKKEFFWMEEIGTGRMKGEKMSESLSEKGWYAAILRSIESSEAEWLTSHPDCCDEHIISRG